MRICITVATYHVNVLLYDHSVKVANPLEKIITMLTIADYISIYTLGLTPLVYQIKTSVILTKNIKLTSYFVSLINFF